MPTRLETRRPLPGSDRVLATAPGLAVVATLALVDVFLREDDDGATAEIVAAGHPLPLLARADGARQVGEFSRMLGAYAVQQWRRTTVEIEPGDVLVLYTDGVFDAVGDGEPFGEDRLQHTLVGVADAGDAVERVATAAAPAGARPDRELEERRTR